MVQELELDQAQVLVAVGPVQVQVQLHPRPVQVQGLEVQARKQVHLLDPMPDHGLGQDQGGATKDVEGAVGVARGLDMVGDQVEEVAQGQDKVTDMVKAMAMVKGMGVVMGIELIQF